MPLGLEVTMLKALGVIAATGALGTFEMVRRDLQLSKKNNRILTGEDEVEDDRGLLGRVDRIEARAERNERAHREDGNLPMRRADGGHGGDE